MIQADGAGSSLTGSYKVFMELTQWQWLSYPQFWADAVRLDFSKGRLTQAQVDSIWKRRESVVNGMRDVKGNDSTIPPPPPSDDSLLDKVKGSLNDIGDTFNGIGDKIGDGLNNLKDDLTSGAKYVAIGAGVLILILILGRR